MKNIVITGATSGIGLQMAKDLLSTNDRLILANRNSEKAKKVKEELLDIEPKSDIELVKLDLSSFTSIKECVNDIKNKFGEVDVLINNAGLFMDTRKFTEEGFEMTMGVNYLGTYLFTELMLPYLKKDLSKIIFVSSAAAYFGRLWLKKDFFSKHPHGFKAYSDSKLALMVYVADLDRRLKDSNTIIKAVHPGDIYTGIWKGETKLMEIAAKRKRKKSKSVEEGSYIGVLLVKTNKYDTSNHIFYRYDEKPMKLPRKARNDKFIDSFIKYTDEVISNN